MIDQKAINEKGKNQAVARKIRFWTQDGDFSLADELTGKQRHESLQNKYGKKSVREIIRSENQIRRKPMEKRRRPKGIKIIFKWKAQFSR